MQEREFKRLLPWYGEVLWQTKYAGKGELQSRQPYQFLTEWLRRQLTLRHKEDKFGVEERTNFVSNVRLRWVFILIEMISRKLEKSSLEFYTKRWKERLQKKTEAWYPDSWWVWKEETKDRALGMIIYGLVEGIHPRETGQGDLEQIRLRAYMLSLHF